MLLEHKDERPAAVAGMVPCPGVVGILSGIVMASLGTLFLLATIPST
ncbi:MAG: hypothetical protein JXI32_01265 [Deltaproteobacteria bacterium]|nr:hypothetical protein [Deltaproteobacteria bacterium]